MVYFQHNATNSGELWQGHLILASITKTKRHKTYVNCTMHVRSDLLFHVTINTNLAMYLVQFQNCHTTPSPSESSLDFHGDADEMHMPN